MAEKSFRHKLHDLNTRRKILHVFSKKTIDYYDVVEHYYIEDGLAYISCNVRNYYDIIDHYSVRGYEWPNEEFLRFIDDNANYIPSEFPIVLEICGSNFTAKQQETIIRTLGRYYELRFADAQLTVENKRFKARCLFGMAILSAIVLFLYGLFFSNLPGLMQETLLIVFWFFLWEWGDVFALEIRREKTNRTEAAQLSAMKIIFSDRFIDEPLDEETKEEIIDEIMEG